MVTLTFVPFGFVYEVSDNVRLCLNQAKTFTAVPSRPPEQGKHSQVVFISLVVSLLMGKMTLRDNTLSNS